MRDPKHSITMLKNFHFLTADKWMCLFTVSPTGNSYFIAYIRIIDQIMIIISNVNHVL